MNRNLKVMIATALGIALFVVLALCLQVPVFENYYLCLGYVAMAVYCCSFGPLAGTVVGFFGVILYCVVIDGMRGMPGWALGNLVIGIALGFAFRAAKNTSAFIADAVMLVLSLPVCAALDKTARKMFPGLAQVPAEES